MERVVRIDSQTGDLSAVHRQRSRDVASLLAITVETQGQQVRGGQLDGVPLEDHGGLGRIAAVQDGDGGFVGAEGGEYLVLQGAEVGLGGGFFGVVLADGDVDDGAGGDVWGQEDGGELDLRVERQHD